ncbi:hypothetical protein JCM11251_007708 [Rhodosporidiobolus azoricus]
MLIDGIKFACEPCKKGHRQSHCNHTDRPLFEIGRRGRPVTACKECRAARKINNCHRTCTHMTEQEKDEASHPLLKTLPNGSKDLASVNLIRRSSSVRSRSSASSAAPSTSRTPTAASSSANPAAAASEEDLATVGRKKSVSRPPISRRSSSAAQKKPHDLAHGHLADHPTHVSTSFSPYPHHAVKEHKTSKAVAKEVQQHAPHIPAAPPAQKPVLPHYPYSAFPSAAASPLGSVGSGSGSSRASPAPPARSLSAPTAPPSQQQFHPTFAAPTPSFAPPCVGLPFQPKPESPAPLVPQAPQPRAMTTSELASAFFFRDFAEAAPTDFSSPVPPPPIHPPSACAGTVAAPTLSASPPSDLPPTFPSSSSTAGFDYAAFLSSVSNNGVAPSATEFPPRPAPSPAPSRNNSQPRVAVAPMFGSVDDTYFPAPLPNEDPSVGAAAAVEAFSLPPLSLPTAASAAGGRSYYEFATQLEPVPPENATAEGMREQGLGLGIPFGSVAAGGGEEGVYQLPSVPIPYQTSTALEAFPAVPPSSTSFAVAPPNTASPALPQIPQASTAPPAVYPSMSDSFSSLPPPNPAIYGYPLHAVESHASYTSYASSSGIEGGFPSSNASAAASAYNSGYESATGGAASALERLDLDFDFSSDAFSPSGAAAARGGQAHHHSAFGIGSEQQSSASSSAVQSGGEEDAAMGATDLDGILEWLASSASAGVFPPTPSGSASASTSGAGTPSLPSTSSAAGGTVASLSSFTGNPSSGFSSSASSLRQSPLLPTSTFFNPAPANFALPPPSAFSSSYSSTPAPASLLGPSEPGAVDEAGYEEDDEAEDGEPDRVRQRREGWSATVRAEGGRRKKKERNPTLAMFRSSTITCADQAGGDSGEEDEDGSGGSGGSGGEQDDEDAGVVEAEERAAAIRRSNAFTARFGLPLLDIDDGPDEDDLERFGIDEDWLRRVGTEEVRLDDDGGGEFGLGGGVGGGGGSGMGWGVWEGFGEDRGAVTKVKGKMERTPVPEERVEEKDRGGAAAGEGAVKKEEEWWS